MIPRLLLSVLKSPVNDIRKYIISSIINIVIKNNNIQDIIKTTQPLILVKNKYWHDGYADRSNRSEVIANNN